MDNNNKKITARELMCRIRYLIEVEGVDPESEVVITSTDEYFAEPNIVDVDWIWSGPIDEGDTTKMLNITIKREE